MSNQRANAFQAVMHARRLAGVEAHSPAIAYFADSEVDHADIKGGQQMIQGHVRA